MVMLNYGSKSERDGRFYNIFPSTLLVGICGYDEDEMWAIVFEEDDDGDYWSFQDVGEETFHLIFPHKVLFDLCFAYGVDAEVKAGKGRIVHLKVVKAVPLSSVQKEKEVVDFKTQVQSLRKAVWDRGWEVNSRNRNGKHYVTILWNENTSPAVQRLEPKQVREAVNEVFPHATMTSYAAYSNAVFRTNPEANNV